MLLLKLRAAAVLAIMFLWDLLTASLGVARIVLAPRIRTDPGIVVVPVALERPWAVALFAAFTSLTPGSTCLHVAADGSRLFVHLLDARDGAITVARFKRIYERWLAELEK